MTSSSLPPARPGQVVFQQPVPSKLLATARMVRVYLPPSYDQPGRRFPVLYVHDGQNAFSTAGDHVAFGWGNWRLDQTASQLSSAGEMRETIMVAVDNSAERYAEYRGPAYGTSEIGWAAAENRCFKKYSRFLVEELKPMIDHHYRTEPGPSTTGLLGSSMGGLCSIALAWWQPEIFGAAASLSGAFQVERREFLNGMLRKHKGNSKPLRLYLDSGVLDYTGGDEGRRHTSAVVQELRRIGWRDGVDLVHFTDDQLLTEPQLEQAGLPSAKWTEAQSSQHNEFYWRLRVWRALTFMFPTR